MINELLKNKEVLEPETLRSVYGVSEEDMDGVQAMQTLMHSTGFWEDTIIFEKIVRALNGLPVNFVNFQGVRVEHMWYAITVADKIWSDREYSWEVQKFIQWVSNEDGVYVYPPMMDDLDNRFYDEAYKLSKNPDNLADRNVFEVQASKLIAINAYIENQKNNK